MISFTLIMRYSLSTLSKPPTNQNKRRKVKSSPITLTFLNRSKMISIQSFHPQVWIKQAWNKIAYLTSCRSWTHSSATAIIYFKRLLTKMKPKSAGGWVICIRGIRRRCRENKVKRLRRSGWMAFWIKIIVETLKFPKTYKPCLTPTWSPLRTSTE